VNSVERLRKSTKEQIAALDRKIHYVWNNSGANITNEGGQKLQQIERNVRDLSKRVGDGTTALFDAQEEMKEIQSGIKT
jgi:Rad3-related DNA helicase